MLRSSSFLFDGVSSEEYGVMIYFLNDEESRELGLGTDVELIEDRLPRRVSPINYGVDMNRPMSFPLTFGSTEYLEDYDVDAILSWLTGHQQYKWLEFVDNDHYVRYKCHLNNMQTTYINGLPVAFTCDVVCDGQFAYEYPIDTTYNIDENEYSVNFFNRSSYNGYLYPELDIEFGDNCSTLTIVNETDNDREFKIKYFDRTSIDTTADETVVETTIANQLTSIGDDSDENNITWGVKLINGAKESYNDMIYGKDTIVCLPKNGNTVLYSNDMGTTWNEATLPHSGSWIGCYGEPGFVAICTDANTAIASFSKNGDVWSSDIIDLPVEQNWKRVVYAKYSKVLSTSAFIAIGGPDSDIVAVSLSGWSWSIPSSTSSIGNLPIVQNWESIITGGNITIAIGGSTNKAAISVDGDSFRYIELPMNQTWTSGCYGENGFIILCNSTLTQNGAALKSSDGIDWEVINFPIGNWSDVIYSYKYSAYVAIDRNRFVYSYDGVNWNSGVLPYNASKLSIVNGEYVAMLGEKYYLLSDSSAILTGSFSIELPQRQIETDEDGEIVYETDINGDLIPVLDENGNHMYTEDDDGNIVYEYKYKYVDDGLEISDVYINAIIDNISGTESFISCGTQTLASFVNHDGAMINSGGTDATLTINKLEDIDVPGVQMSAVYNPETRVATVSFKANANQPEALNAPLRITIDYKMDTYTDLGYDGLTVHFDNQNQIITSNKELLNLYQYFNMKFLRLVKGINKLRIYTDGGECKLKMRCEFLRKVGGR